VALPFDIDMDSISPAHRYHAAAAAAADWIVSRRRLIGVRISRSAPPSIGHVQTAGASDRRRHSTDDWTSI